MTTMTLQNFINVHKSKLKVIKKLTVRDLDELEKNTFIAYVDEGNNSFDVQIVFDSKKNIKETSCDCVDGGTCNHIIALVNFISENKTEKTVIKRVTKKKLSETDTILEAISNDDLRIWISDILNINKEIAFAFKNNFGTKQNEVTKENIEKAIQESISSVIGKRKKCETNEVKKIVDALNVSLKPYLNIILSKVTKENYDFLQHLVNKLEEFNYNYYLSSNRILKLVENITDLQLKSLFNIKDYEEWQNATKFYLNLIFKKKFYNSELEFIKKIYEFSKTNKLQYNFIINILENNFEVLYKNLDNNFLINFEFESFFLIIFTENNLIHKHIRNFKPRRFHNEHNLLLIQELLKINQTNLAEEYCLEQIAGNFKQEYDLPYVKLLISLYKKNNDTPKLANILSEYGKFVLNIEDYIFIKENANIEKFKKYRQAVLTNARNAYQSGDEEAFDFYFEIKKLDGKASDIITMLENSRNIAFINKYKEIAFKLDHLKFIVTICNMYIYSKIKNDILNEIVSFIYENTESANLKFYLRNINPYRDNPFYNALMEKLKS